MKVRFQGVFSSGSYSGTACDANLIPEIPDLLLKLDTPEIVLCKNRPKVTAGCWGDFFIKRYNLPGFWAQFKRRCRRGKPEKAWEIESAMCLARLETMPVLAQVRENCRGHWRDYLITRRLPENFTSVLAHCREKTLEDTWSLFTQVLLPEVAEMHRQSIVHGDLNLRNLYLTPDWRCGFLDLDGGMIFSGRSVPAEWRERELSRLFSSWLMAPDFQVRGNRRMIREMIGIYTDRLPGPLREEIMLRQIWEFLHRYHQEERL